jgi:hypothetical protein
MQLRRRVTSSNFTCGEGTSTHEILMAKVMAVVLLAACAGFSYSAFAQLRTDLRTVVSPIVSSSSNGISYAWLYDPTDRSVYVCRIGAAAGDTLECKAKATLP